MRKKIPNAENMHVHRLYQIGIAIKKSGALFSRIGRSLLYKKNWRILYHFLNEYTTHIDCEAEKSAKTVYSALKMLVAARGKSNEKSIVLFVTHDLDRNGAPYALLQMVCNMREFNDIQPVVLAPYDGVLREEFENSGCFVVVSPKIFHAQEDVLLRSLVSLCDIVIVNTSACAQFVALYGNICKECFWWVHETLEYFQTRILAGISPADIEKIKTSPVQMWCGSMCCSPLAKFFDKEVKELLYGLPDMLVSFDSSFRSEKVTFLLAGTFEERKGQLVLVDAIGTLPSLTRAKAKFYLIGSTMIAKEGYERIVHERAKEFSEIEILPNMPVDNLMEYYKKSDVLVSASLDDPMPIVVTHGFMFGMPCIITDAIGQAGIVQSADGVDIVPAGDSQKLADALASFIEDTEKISRYAEKSRKLFDRNFSLPSFNAQLQKYLALPESAKQEK